MKLNQIPSKKKMNKYYRTLDKKNTSIYFDIIASFTVDSANDAVAFTKGLVSHAHLTKGEIIIFDKTITNINANFTSDGKFQVQIPGIYSFHFHALSRNDEEILLDLYKNKEYIVSIYAYTLKDWSDAGNTVVLELQKGDLIFVKANDNFDNWIYGAAGEIDTTFSGELVFPETTGKKFTLKMIL